MISSCSNIECPQQSFKKNDNSMNYSTYNYMYIFTYFLPNKYHFITICIQSTMAASQDKVQAILESLLEDSLPLVHKGIFTTEQLRNAMCERQKHENNMMKPTYKLSDYLKALQFEYSLERERRHRIETQCATNPLLKKQTKTDFVIIKRIIRLWDRTTHKFKSDVSIWKQYLDFCITSNSKKQFYKALSSSIRFLPFQLDLWRIGIQYEIQIGLNLWKARKLYIKALKMNSKKVELWMDMFKFQIYFLTQLSLRQKAIQGETQTIQFIMPEEEVQNNDSEDQQNDNEEGDNFNIDKHHEILITVAEQAISKIPSQRQYIIDQIANMIAKELDSCKDKNIKKVLLAAKSVIVPSNYSAKIGDFNHTKKQVILESVSDKLMKSMEFIEGKNTVSFEEIEKTISPFILKQKQLQKILQLILNKQFQLGIQVLAQSKKLKCLSLPSHTLNRIITQYQDLQIKQSPHLSYIKSQISKIQAKDFQQNAKLMQAVIKFNKMIKNAKANNDIYRSLSIHCRTYPQVIERCLHFIQSQ